MKDFVKKKCKGILTISSFGLGTNLRDSKGTIIELPEIDQTVITILLMLSLAVMIPICHAVVRLPGYLSWNVPFDGAAIRPITGKLSSYIHAPPAL